MTRALKGTVAAAFAVGLAAGAETTRYRAIELVTSAGTVYAPYLAQHGITQSAFVLYFLLTEGLVALSFAGVAAFLALRGPGTAMSSFAAIALVLYGVTIPPPMHALVVNAPPLPAWLAVERSVGIAAFVVFLYLFPDGRWTWPARVLSPLAILWTLSWSVVPAFNPYRFHHPWPFVAIAALFASGVAVQLYGFHYVRTPLERQQTKWVVYAVTASVAGDFVTHLPWQVLPLRAGPDLVVLVVHQPFFVAFQLAVPIAIGFSALRYHLWEIDFIVSRTVIYAAVTTIAAVVWEAVNITSTKLIERAMGQQASAFAGGTATVITGFFLKPMYAGVKGAVDRRFTPATLDLSDEFPEFESDVRTRLPAAHVVDALVDHLPPLFDVDGCAMFLWRDGSLTLRAARGVSDAQAVAWLPDRDALDALRQGKTARLGAEPDAPVCVPLVVPRSRYPDLLGVLTLGRRGGEKGYSQLEFGALEALGRKAGMALYLADARAAADPRPGAAT